MTIAVTRWLLDVFGIVTPTICASALNVGGSKADRLVAICREVGADRYLSAPGSREYIEDSGAFQAASVFVDYHDYAHPEYRQAGNGFIPYIGAMDLLFNEGRDAGLGILRSGVAGPAS